MGEDTVSILLRISRQLLADVDNYAGEHDLSRSVALRHLIGAGLQRMAPESIQALSEYIAARMKEDDAVTLRVCELSPERVVKLGGKVQVVKRSRKKERR